MPQKSRHPVCGYDEVQLDDGTIRPMTEVELLQRKIDETTSDVGIPFFFTVEIYCKPVCLLVTPLLPKNMYKEPNKIVFIKCSSVYTGPLLILFISRHK